METTMKTHVDIKTISTQYEGGVLRPLERLDLTEHQMVKVQILPWRVQITGLTAQRKVSRLMLDEVSYLMGGEQPTLVETAMHLYWRVPLVLTYPTYGTVGTVGYVDVDTETGDLILPPGGLDEFRDNAHALAAHLPPPTN